MESQTQSLLERRYNTIGKYSPLFYERPIHLARGEGVWLYDTQGNRFLDCYNNVPHVGHCHPKIVSAISEQASTLNIHTRYLHENIVNYIERLTATFADSLNAAMLTCSGSEANELALRMARFITGGQGIIVSDAAYHGNTEAVGELGTGFMPEAKTTKRVRSFPIPDTYRGLPGVPVDQLKAAYLKHIEAAIEGFDADGIGFAGMLICPDFANEGLLNIPDGFMEEAAQLVRDAGGLVIYDEVQAGFGRTGEHMWAHQWYDVVPDIVTMGKPMGNGFPLAGLVANLDHVNAFTKHAMYFNTFGGTPVACAVGNAVLDALEQEQLPQNAVTTSQYVTDGLIALQQKFSMIGDVRSRGMFFGVELVLDPETKEPATKQAKQIVNRMRNQGVLISTIGPWDSVLKIRPPMPFKPEHADILLSALDNAFAAFSEEVKMSDPRLAQLTAAAEASMSQWSLEGSTLDLIKFRENAVYKLTSPEGERFALRIHRPGYHDYAALLSELQWMSALSDFGIETPTVIKTNSGELMTKVVIPETGEDVYVDLFGWVDGTSLGADEGVVVNAEENRSMYYTIGEIAAQLHNQSSTWALPEGFKRHAWDLDGLVGETPFWGRFWELELLTAEQQVLLVEARAKAAEILQSVDKNSDNYSLIHADFDPHNIMIEGDKIRPIDFDDAGFGWHMFEIATALYFMQTEPHYEVIKDAIIEGYRSKRDLSDDQLELLDLFLALRGFTYLGWIRSRQETETAKELSGDLIERAVRQSHRLLEWAEHYQK